MCFHMFVAGCTCHEPTRGAGEVAALRRSSIIFAVSSCLSQVSLRVSIGRRQCEEKQKYLPTACRYCDAEVTPQHEPQEPCHTSLRLSIRRAVILRCRCRAAITRILSVLCVCVNRHAPHSVAKCSFRDHSGLTQALSRAVRFGGATWRNILNAVRKRKKHPSCQELESRAEHLLEAHPLMNCLSRMEIRATTGFRVQCAAENLTLTVWLRLIRRFVQAQVSFCEFCLTLFWPDFSIKGFVAKSAATRRGHRLGQHHRHHRRRRRTTKSLETRTK